MTLGACRPAVFHSAQRSIAATPVRRDLDMGKPHPDQMASLKGEIPQHIHDLCDKICALNMIEAAELGELIKIKLKIPDNAVMGMPMMGAPMMGGAAPAGAAGGQRRQRVARLQTRRPRRRSRRNLNSNLIHLMRPPSSR